jgi:hypothetical protein
MMWIAMTSKRVYGTGHLYEASGSYEPRRQEPAAVC